MIDILMIIDEFIDEIEFELRKISEIWFFINGECFD